MDISKLASKELQILLKRIPKEINKRKKQEKLKLRNQIAQIAGKHGYSLSELVGTAPRPKNDKQARKRKPVAVKYRHPEQVNLTWTGRGRKPHWVTEWLAQGKKIESLSI